MTFKEAKQTCKRLFHEFTAIIGSGNKLVLPGQQVRQRLAQQFAGLEGHEYRLQASTGWRYSSTTHSSSSSRWQPSSDLWSTWSWDSWNSSYWTEQSFFLLQFFFNVSWQSTGGRERCANSTPTAHHFLMHSCCAVVSQSCCQSVQSHIDPMHLHGSSHERRCLRFAQKTLTPHRAMSYTFAALDCTKHGHTFLTFLNQSSSEQNPCEDRRTQLSGSLAEPRPFAGNAPKQLVEDRDCKHFT